MSKVMHVINFRTKHKADESPEDIHKEIQQQQQSGNSPPPHTHTHTVTTAH